MSQKLSPKQVSSLLLKFGLVPKSGAEAARILDAILKPQGMRAKAYFLPLPKKYSRTRSPISSNQRIVTCVEVYPDFRR